MQSYTESGFEGFEIGLDGFCVLIGSKEDGDGLAGGVGDELGDGCGGGLVVLVALLEPCINAAIDGNIVSIFAPIGVSDCDGGLFIG